MGPERIAYCFGTAQVAVDIENGDAARWLSEFMTPWFPVVAAGHHHVLVRMTTSAVAMEALAVRQANANTQPEPGFRLDRGLACLPAWTESDGTTVAADAAWRCFYRVRPGGVDVLGAPGDYLPRVGLMRAVRELLILGATPRPATLDLHAAALVHRGSAVLLAGARRRGKTTLLAHALASGEAALMANDRVIVDLASGVAEGVPTVVSVREGTEQLFPALGRGWPRRATLLHADEVSHPDACAAATGSRLVLSPAQFAGQLGARVEPRASLGTIVFPEICDDEPHWSLQRLATDEARRRLSEAMYAGGVAPHERTLFDNALAEPGQATTAPGPEQQDLLTRLVATVPMVHLRMGPDVYLNDASAWLHTLPHAPHGASA
jgi:hypothetical protein